MLSSCKEDDVCIDPDDWGGVQKLTVSSYGSSSQLHDDGSGTESIDWQLGPRLDGKRVVMVIKNTMPQEARKKNCQSNEIYTPENSWMPIWGKHFKPDVPGNPYKSLSMCTFQDRISSDGYPWCHTGANNMASDTLPVMNLPCKLYRGLGLYSMVSNTKIENPSYSWFGRGTDENGTFFHIGDSASELKKDGTHIIEGSADEHSNFFSQGCPTGGISFMPPDSSACSGNMSNCALYFKILDRFYGTGDDNYGSYTIEFKQGVQTSNVRLITRFVSVVNALMCDVSQTMFEGLVKNTSFMGYIRVMLVLTIAFLGASVLTGFSDLTYKEMLILVLKIGLVLQLISTGSWDFFNDTLFKFFTNGIGEITGIIFGEGNLAPIEVDLPDGIDASEQCKRQTLAGFTAFDDVLAQLFSYATTMKVLSLFTYKGAGFLYVPIIYLCLTVVLFILLKSLLVYLVSILVISVVISLAPIFISFILFDKTKHMFDGWLKTLISYFIQPIIIMAFAFFVLQIFMTQLHSLLGVRVCWKQWANLHFFKLYAWKADYSKTMRGCILTPGPILNYCDSGGATCKDENTGSLALSQDGSQAGQLNLLGDLSIARYPFSGKGSCTADTMNIVPPKVGDSCTPYTCTQLRFIDFPYVDIGFPPDQERGAELEEGTLISIKDIVILILLIWFMYEFNKLVPNIAKQLSSGSTLGGVDLSKTAGDLGGGIGGSLKYMASKPAAVAGFLASKAAQSSGLTGAARAIRFGIVGLKEAVQDKIYSKIDEKIIKPVSKKIEVFKSNTADKWNNFAQANPNAAMALKVGAGALKFGAQAVLTPHSALSALGAPIGQNIYGKLDKSATFVGKVAGSAKAIVGYGAGQAMDVAGQAAGQVKETIANKVQAISDKAMAAVGNVGNKVKEAVARKLDMTPPAAVDVPPDIPGTPSPDGAAGIPSPAGRAGGTPGGADNPAPPDLPPQEPAAVQEAVVRHLGITPPVANAPPDIPGTPTPDGAVIPGGAAPADNPAPADVPAPIADVPAASAEAGPEARLAQAAAHEADVHSLVDRVASVQGGSSDGNTQQPAPGAKRTGAT